MLFKRPYISFIITTSVWNVKTTYRKSWPGNLFQLLTLTPSSVSSVVIIIQRPYIFLISRILLILRGEITTAAVALLSEVVKIFSIQHYKSD